MCGIYGNIAPSEVRLGHPEVLDRMGERLRHRGPDGHAVLTAAHAGIGTERLRIIDLHERADQPFASPDGAVWLVCNGEIYNAAEIRRRYPAFPFRSQSDVESILPLYLEHGPDAVRELDGMFGLAIWDSRTRQLLLARDRAGEKPLFFATCGDEIVFASEVQCLLEHPATSRAIDPEAVDDYLSWGFVGEPRTMFRDIRRIEAGTWTLFSAGQRQTTRYWDPAAVGIEPRGPRQAVPALRTLIEGAVTKQVTSDVPVGVFISGGLDSSILAALASRVIGPDQVHTFSARFSAESYDESGEAEVLARQMRTRFVPVRADDQTLREAFDRVCRDVAEPVADPAILPTYLLARAARQHVTVILSGEGADELFGGYPTYLGHRVAPRYAALPAPVRGAVAGLVARLPASSRKVTLEFLLKRFIRDAERPWQERHRSWFGTGLPRERSGAVYAASADPLREAMLLDYRGYLRDNLLVKVDRATMLASVEARAPFLDREVTRFALSLPTSLRVRRLTTKWILKKAAEAWLPRDVIWQRKRGLSVPVAEWIRSGMGGEVDRLLSVETLAKSGMVDPAGVKTLLDTHRSGSQNHARPLWAVLMLQKWYERWV